MFSFPPSSHTHGGVQTRGHSLLSYLALPYSRLTSRSPSPCSRKKIHPVSTQSSGVASEQNVDGSSNMTCDLTDGTSAPLSPGVLKDIEQGTLGAVVRGHEGRTLSSILIPDALLILWCLFFLDILSLVVCPKIL